VSSYPLISPRDSHVSVSPLTALSSTPLQIVAFQSSHSYFRLLCVLGYPAASHRASWARPLPGRRCSGSTRTCGAVAMRRNPGCPSPLKDDPVKAPSLGVGIPAYGLQASGRDIKLISPIDGIPVRQTTIASPFILFHSISFAARVFIKGQYSRFPSSCLAPIGQEKVHAISRPVKTARANLHREELTSGLQSTIVFQATCVDSRRETASGSIKEATRPINRQSRGLNCTELNYKSKCKSSCATGRVSD
jgi:hypothetical protein